LYDIFGNIYILLYIYASFTRHRNTPHLGIIK